MKHINLGQSRFALYPENDEETARFERVFREARNQNSATATIKGYGVYFDEIAPGRFLISSYPRAPGAKVDGNHWGEVCPNMPA